MPLEAIWVDARRQACWVLVGCAMDDEMITPNKRGALFRVAGHHGNACTQKAANPLFDLDNISRVCIWNSIT